MVERSLLASWDGSRAVHMNRMVGYFINTVAVRIQLSPEENFRSIVGTADKAVRGAMAHSIIPFTKLVELLRIAPDSSRTPVFQTMVGWEEEGAGDDIVSIIGPGLNGVTAVPRAHQKDDVTEANAKFEIELDPT